jgi:glycosyltransferase involved in cell wall biosynthesis
MWNGKRIAVVLPTYNERDSIAAVIDGFTALGLVDDILVVNNNAAAGTSEQVATTAAREVLEPRQGYGAAIRRGLADVDADLVAICEPDGTFDPQDLLKLLPFSRECDLVIGSRTASYFIRDGANMGWFVKWGNWTVAKLVEVLFNTPCLTDVGCTFRVASRDRVAHTLRHARVDGSSFGLEMLMLAVVDRARIVQVPVNYYKRVGVSSVTGDLGKTLRLGSCMFAMVFWYRLRASRAARFGTAHLEPEQPRRIDVGGSGARLNEDQGTRPLARTGRSHPR